MSVFFRSSLSCVPRLVLSSRAARLIFPSKIMRLLVLLASVLMTAAAVSCMDEKGNAVDWFVAIK